MKIERPGRLRGLARDRWAVLVLPALVFLVVFFLAPLVTMSIRSITDPPNAGLSNYTEFFGQDANLRALRNTFWIAFLSTLTCLLVGYPYAYLMTIVPGRSACYRCAFEQPPPAGAVPSCREAGVLGATAGIVGSIQALEAIKLITGVGEPLTDRILQLDARGMEQTIVSTTRRADCPACGRVTAAPQSA